MNAAVYNNRYCVSISGHTIFLFTNSLPLSPDESSTIF